MLSNKEITCPVNLLNVAHKKKGVKAGIVNAGKPLPMLSVQDAVNENLIQPIFIKENLSGTEDIESMPEIKRFGLDVLNETCRLEQAIIKDKRQPNLAFFPLSSNRVEIPVDANQIQKLIELSKNGL